MESNNAYVIVMILMLAMMFQQVIQQSRYNSDIIDKLLGAVNVKHDPRKQKNTIGEQSMSYYYTMKKRVVEVDSAKLIFQADSHRFAMVTDMDIKSRDPNKFLWKSLFKSGSLVRVSEDKYNIQWDEDVQTLTSRTATKNRSMELSALVRYRHWLLAFCDYTGLVFKILPKTSSVFQRHAIADGDGERAKPMKIEWATVKDDLVWIGSNGKEWTDEKTGKVLHENTMWVKTIDANGKISNINWEMIYRALRTAANSTFPGYLWHEAVHWDARTKHWIILPRKQSHSHYTPEDDEKRGTNILIIANEDFTEIKISEVGPKEPVSKSLEPHVDFERKFHVRQFYTSERYLTEHFAFGLFFVRNTVLQLSVKFLGRKTCIWL